MGLLKEDNKNRQQIIKEELKIGRLLKINNKFNSDTLFSKIKNYFRLHPQHGILSFLT